VSAPRFLLDTNICIFIRQNRYSSVTDRFVALSPGEAAISVITYGELAYGAEKSQQREIALSGLQTLLRFLPVLSLPEDGGRAYGLIRSQLERQGNSISSNDLWIAAHALSASLILVTNNEREFRRVPGLTIENWAMAP
jgi:tRNA(fMet)-specific endonuclease VapC